MSQYLEPTYLRYIYDGLIKGSVHPKNATELPEGLIGLYDDAFDDSISAVERQKLTQCFGFWALLKKEVSVQFVAEVLGENEDKVIDFISTYSAWFNSLEFGKYQLYHERLKVYVLQKLSGGELRELHEMLITRLEKAITEEKADEFEHYGLEFLSAHYFVVDAEDTNLHRLTTLCENERFIDRQVSFSGHFEWTKVIFRFLAISGFNKKQEHITLSALGLLKAHLNENADIDSIFRLIECSKMDLAILRIDSLLQHENKDNKSVFLSQLLDELIVKSWIDNNHLMILCQYIDRQGLEGFGYNFNLKTLQSLWNRGVVFFCFNEVSKSIHSTTEVNSDFALTFFCDISKVKYLSATAQNLEEFVKAIERNKLIFQDYNPIEQHINDILGLNFIRDKRFIDLDQYGTSELFFNHLILKDKVDDFIDFLDWANEYQFAKRPKKIGAVKRIYTVQPYLFFCQLHLNEEHIERSKYFLNKAYHWLKYYIEGLERGNWFKSNEISVLINLADKTKRSDIVAFF